MSGLESLYQDLILDHAKHPHGFGLAAEEGRTATAHQRNPVCGDEITLRVRLRDDDTIRDVSWEGAGCSISQASASMLAVLIDEAVDEGGAAGGSDAGGAAGGSDAVGDAGSADAGDESPGPERSSETAGLARAEASALIDDFREALRSRGQIPIDEDRFGDAAALSGVSKFTARVKCAMLAWVAFEDALARA